MQREEVLPDQAFLPFPSYSARSKKDALLELMRPCDRFRSPLSTMERLRLMLSKEFAQQDMLANVTDVLAPGVPLNWQSILRYLHRRGVIDEPHFTFTRRSNDLPKTYGVELRAHTETATTDGRVMDMYAYASSFDVEVAMGKVIGEILERYFLTLYKRGSFKRASFETVKSRALDISALNSFLPWQAEKNLRFKKDVGSSFYWVRGERIDGRPVYIPSQLIFWNYDFSHDTNEPILAQPITNGAAGHFTKDEAILGGLLELIERDGFLIYWLNGLSPRVIDIPAGQDSDLTRFLDLIERYGLDIQFLDTTTDVGIPSVTCVLIDSRGAEPQLIVSGASGFSMRDTILKSGHEALNILQLRTERKDFSLPDNYEPFIDEVIGHRERIALWKGAQMMERFSFFLQGEHESIDEFFGNTPQELSAGARLAYVVNKFAALGSGYEIYVYEAKHKVLKTLGYHVVQTIVPQLMPLYLNEHFVPLDSKRLREVPAKIGYEAASELNPWPHPFP